MVASGSAIIGLLVTLLRLLDHYTENNTGEDYSQEKIMVRQVVSQRKPPQEKARPLLRDNAGVGTYPVRRAQITLPLYTWKQII